MAKREAGAEQLGLTGHVVLTDSEQHEEDLRIDQCFLTGQIETKQATSNKQTANKGWRRMETMRFRTTPLPFEPH